MGAGRVVYQDLTRIDKSVSDGDFFEKPALVDAMTRCQRRQARAASRRSRLAQRHSQPHTPSLRAHRNGGALQAAARVRAGLHRRPRHVAGRRRGFLRRARAGDEQARAPAGWPRSAAATTAWIATTGGSARRRRTTRSVERPGAAHAGRRSNSSGSRTKPASRTSSSCRARSSTPTDQPIGPIRDGDSVIFFNFRSDRARQMTRALAFDEFTGFERTSRIRRSHMTTMTQYDRTFTFPVVFPPQSLSGSFAEVMAAQHLTNLRVAETEKYPHVSYFFNCGIEKPYPGEDRILVPSPKVPTYDLQPEMSAQGDHRQSGQRCRAAQARRHHLQLRERRHGGAHRQPRRRREGRRDDRRSASAASSGPCATRGAR